MEQKSQKDHDKRDKAGRRSSGQSMERRSTPRRPIQVEALEATEYDLDTLLEEGIALCEANRWKEGVTYLAAITRLRPPPSALPSRYYSFLGHGLARIERRIDDGVTLCRRAVREGFGDAKNHALLVETLWLAKRRGEAMNALEEGLLLAHDPKSLLLLRQTLERRRPPVVSAISRDHLVNRWLGKITYRP